MAKQARREESALRVSTRPPHRSRRAVFPRRAPTSRDLGTSYKTAVVLAHKIREAMASEMKGGRVGREGKTVETDGAYLGGYAKPANLKENRRDRRLAKNQNGKRRVVVVVRQQGGSTLPAVFKSESAALGWITAHVAKGTQIVADEAPLRNDLHAKYEVPGSTISRFTASTVCIPTVPSLSSLACAVLRWGITTTSQARIWSVTLRSPRGVGTSAV
jgi:hypothetical protein